MNNYKYTSDLSKAFTMTKNYTLNTLYNDITASNKPKTHTKASYATIYLKESWNWASRQINDKQMYFDPENRAKVVQLGEGASV